MGVKPGLALTLGPSIRRSLGLGLGPGLGLGLTPTLAGGLPSPLAHTPSRLALTGRGWGGRLGREGGAPVAAVRALVVTRARRSEAEAEGEDEGAEEHVSALSMFTWQAAKPFARLQVNHGTADPSELKIS